MSKEPYVENYLDDEERELIEAMEAAGGNVALLDGKLLEEPVVKKARRVLDFI